MERIEGTVLVSDKNRGLLTALVLLLHKFFSKVITEENPQRIVELVAAGDIDIVVLDAGNNGTSGKDECSNIIREITALGQNVQVVVLTNFGQSHLAMELADAGAFDFVIKPWNNEKLLVTLRNAYTMRKLSSMLKKVGMSEENMDSEGERSQKLSGRGKGEERVFTLEQMERKMMRAAVKRCKGNISMAAEQLGITRQTLYNKGKKYELFD